MSDTPKQAIPPSMIQTVEVSRIRPYWRNPRKNEAAIEFVAKAIQNYGFQVPLLVDKEFVIITGHSRYGAALHLGLKEIPVIVSDLSAGKARQFRIADNKTSENAVWDFERLTSELLDVSDLAKMVEDFKIDSWKGLVDAVTESAIGSGELDDDTTPAAPAPEAATPPPPPIEYHVICPHCGQKSTLVEGKDC